MATGVTWWYSSAGSREWRYLNARSETLGSIGLGDFDGDGRCDVFAVQGRSWNISRGGTAPMVPLPGTDDIASRSASSRSVISTVIATPTSSVATPTVNGSPSRPASIHGPLSQSSSFPLSALRFGDFDGNGVTDVISISGGRWAVSWGARSTWEQLNPDLSSSLASVSIANVDGIPGDDIVRYVREDAISGRWEVSSGGAGPWTTLTSFSYPDTYQNRLLNLTAYMKTFVGRFDAWNGADVLALEYSRGSFLFSLEHANLSPYGLYAY